MLVATPTLTALNVKARAGDMGAAGFLCSDEHFTLPNLKSLCLAGEFQSQSHATCLLSGVPQLEKLHHTFSFTYESWLALKRGGANLTELQVGGTHVRAYERSCNYYCFYVVTTSENPNASHPTSMVFDRSLWVRQK